MSAEPTTDPVQLAREAHARLARTVNIALDLGASQERGWTMNLQRPHLEDCAHHRFTAIRLLTDLAAHQTPSGLDPRTLQRIEQITDDATSLGLAVVIASRCPASWQQTRSRTLPPRWPRSPSCPARSRGTAPA